MMTNSIPVTRCSYCDALLELPVAGQLPFPLCGDCKTTLFQNWNLDDLDFLARKLQALSSKTGHPLVAGLFALAYDRLSQENTPSLNQLCAEYESTYDAICTSFWSLFPKIYYQVGIYLLGQGNLHGAYDAFDQSTCHMNADIYFNYLQEPADMERQMALSFQALSFVERQLGNPKQADEWLRVAATYARLHMQSASSLCSQLEDEATADPEAYRNVQIRIAGHYEALADRLGEHEPIRSATLRRQAKKLRDSTETATGHEQ